MFHRRRNKRDLREIISKASNFRERAKFPNRIKTIVSQKSSGITKAISEQTISHVTDGRVCYSGSFENEALENEDRSTKHPKLENEAP